MEVTVIHEVRQTAEREGIVDPSWLRPGKDPQFVTVEEGAEGVELVLLHGLFGALSNWDSVFPFFAHFCRPIALQFPILQGHRSEVKVQSLALYTEYFVRERKIQPVTLCGNSLGGHVALRLCLASPQIVDCLILTGTSGLYEHSVDSLPVRPDKRFIRDHMHRVFFNDRFVTEDAIDEIYQIVCKRANILNLIHAARSAKKDNLQELLHKIEVPTLLLWGEDDLVTTMDVAELFAKHITNSTLVTIKNCGHAPMIEYPEWFAEQVQRFLKQHSCHYGLEKDDTNGLSGKPSSRQRKG